MSWKAPPQLREPYDAWKEELKVWLTVTDLDPVKQGGAIFLSLPNPSSARDAVLELTAAVIGAADGVKKITEKLDTRFPKR